jgi:predicted nucleic acid-binding protein
MKSFVRNGFPPTRKTLAIIALKASELGVKYVNSPLHKSDSLIAATAWVKGLILVTRNRRHFEFIDEIRILTPKPESETT